MLQNNHKEQGPSLWGDGGTCAPNFWTGGT